LVFMDSVAICQRPAPPPRTLARTTAFLVRPYRSVVMSRLSFFICNFSADRASLFFTCRCCPTRFHYYVTAMFRRSNVCRKADRDATVKEAYCTSAHAERFRTVKRRLGTILNLTPAKRAVLIRCSCSVQIGSSSSLMIFDFVCQETQKSIV